MPPSEGLSMTRRSACAISLACALPAPAAWAMTPHMELSRKVLVEQLGTLSAVRFLDSAKAADVQTHVIHRDASEVWSDHLRSFWSNPGNETVGLTGLGSLFCLELLARDAGQHLVFARKIAEDEALTLPKVLREAPLNARRRELDTLPHDASQGLYAWVLRSRKTTGYTA